MNVQPPLHEKVELIENREDFVAFVEDLINDLQSHDSVWENSSLDRYLASLAAWVVDMDGYYKNHNKDIPEQVPWKVFAEILLAAKYYE